MAIQGLMVMFCGWVGVLLDLTGFGTTEYSVGYLSISTIYSVEWKIDPCEL